MEQIKAKVHWRLRRNEITISTKGHHIYLGSQFQDHIHKNNIERMNFFFDSEKILLKNNEVGDFKIIRGHNERNTPQFTVSVPHSLLHILAKYNGRHLAKITSEGIEINIGD